MSHPMMNRLAALMSQSGPKDPNYANVSLLLHMDGAGASTTFTDNSQYAHTGTAGGNAQIDSAQSVFGGASGLFGGNGSGDAVAFPANAAFGMQTGDWTWEFRIRFAVAPGGNIVQPIVLAGGLHYCYIGSGGNFVVGTWDGAAIQQVAVAWSPSINTWYACAVTRSGNSYRFFVNGTQQGTTQTLAVNQANASVAASISGSGINYNVNGWIDEVRITKGVARYTANYTIATAAFPNS